MATRVRPISPKTYCLVCNLIKIPLLALMILMFEGFPIVSHLHKNTSSQCVSLKVSYSIKYMETIDPRAVAKFDPRVKDH